MMLKSESEDGRSAGFNCKHFIAKSFKNLLLNVGIVGGTLLEPICRKKRKISHYYYSKHKRSFSQ